MAHPPLTSGTISVALLLPDNPNTPPFIFHWGLILPVNSKSFILHHIAKSNLADEWLYNNPRYDVSQIRSLCVVVELGTVSVEEAQIAIIDNITRSIPIIDSSRLSSGGFECPVNCRVWVKDAIRLLHQAGILTGPCDIKSIENKVWEFGIAYRDKKKSGKPFAIYTIASKG